MTAAEIEISNPAELFKELSTIDVTVPDRDAKIYKDECTYCYKTNFYPGGLYICLRSFFAFCENHVEDHVKKTDSKAFVHLESTKFNSRKLEESGEPIPKITKLAIGKEGGFNNDNHEITDHYHIVTYPNLHQRIPISTELPEAIYEAARKVETCTSAARLQMLKNASNAWDGEIKVISKHADDLPQLDTGKIIPSSGWKCQAEGCDLTENLWLNLTDGEIRCGRTQFISEGVMTIGNNHSREHYLQTGYPLVVKLGTVSRDDTADVYSYDEDTVVLDTNLRQHLLHWGLDMNTLEKTERSTLEIELDLNQKYEWAKCVEDGAELENIYGPGYTGLINIGSSCYMNSVVQGLLLLPTIQKRFATNAKEEFSRVELSEIYNDFNSQVARLLSSMMSGEHAVREFELLSHNGISPNVFKTVVAGQHPEFRTAKQQDVEEYLRYFVEKITANTPKDVEDPTNAMKFKMETRFEDVASGNVRYSDKEEVILGIPVREDLMSIIQPLEGETQIRYQVSLDSLIQASFSPNFIEGFKSPITGENKGASTTQRFKTFPDFLFMQIQKFAMTDDYKARKYDMDIHLTDTIDLSPLRGTGAKPDETLLPENAPTDITPPVMPEYDRELAAQIEEMGFHKNAAIHAAIEMRKTGGNAENAVQWILDKQDDPSIYEPVEPIKPMNTKAAMERPCVQNLIGFGFSAHQANYALSKYPDPNQAAEWLFEHSDEVPPETQEETKGSFTEVPISELPDGDGKYKLVGFISHMGASPHSGHYVAHLLKDDKWILFNDEKVAISQNPPRALGYLYIFKRL